MEEEYVFLGIYLMFINLLMSIMDWWMIFKLFIAFPIFIVIVHFVVSKISDYYMKKSKISVVK